ncbi:MAG TPA: hypothetical protein VMX13_10815, partial [Sedimentisphaerales bacterium]|nr:hypothetical protein [Sedimentisphaerales bacterium]
MNQGKMCRSIFDECGVSSQSFANYSGLSMPRDGRKRRARIIVAILLTQSISLSVCGSGSEVKTCFLPWQVIATKVQDGVRFCENRHSGKGGERASCIGVGGSGLDPNSNYAFVAGETLTFRLPVGAGQRNSFGRLKVNISKWANGLWKEVGQESADTDSNLIKVAEGIEEEGFFRLKFAAAAPESGQFDIEAYAVISADWKRDILAFCRELKEQVETRPDPKLIFSSIAVSHFDHAMEMAGEASFLSGRMLGALVCAIENKRKFEAGACPDLVVGLDKIRLKRFEGAQIAEFVVFVPEDYDPSRKWRVYLYPDPKRFYAGRDYSQRSGLIDVWWPFSGFKGFEWKDYEYFLDILKDRINLDEDRFYLHGHCGNGIPAMAMALQHPDKWAECATLLGNSYRHLAGNALNLPLILVASEQKDGSLIGYFDFAVKCFQYYGCTDFKCSWTEGIVQTRGTPLPEAVRQKRPQRVLYTIESLHSPRAYWVQILGRKDENFTATIDACIEGRTILLKTRNIDAYSLDLVGAPVDSNVPIEIIENGASLGGVRMEVFTKRPQCYEDAVYVKNERIRGPIGDAFTDAYVVVWGANEGGSQLAEISKKTAASLAHGAPCFSDANMPPELLETHNLILVGTAESNRWLAKVSTGLPVQIEAGQIVADGKRFSGSDIGFIL